MGIISDIRDALKDIPISDILRERLIDAENTIERLTKDNVRLQTENADLKRQINDLAQELADNKVTREEFAEARGALFKRKPGHGYYESVYCPNCKRPLSSFGGDFPYRCDRCDVDLDFTLRDVPDILRELG